jgi:hypothetical protein
MTRDGRLWTPMGGVVQVQRGCFPEGALRYLASGTKRPFLTRPSRTGRQVALPDQPVSVPGETVAKPASVAALTKRSS